MPGDEYHRYGYPTFNLCNFALVRFQRRVEESGKGTVQVGPLSGNATEHLNTFVMEPMPQKTSFSTYPRLR
jgi:hypothetical protein